VKQRPARRKRKKSKLTDAACAWAACRARGNSALSEGGDEKQAPAEGVGATSYSCHYCARSNGAQTRDHKLPRKLGGTGIAANIVWCCHMCNVIKGIREYAAFVAFFGEFLREHGDEYRAADPDNGKSVKAMGRKFSAWLHALHNAPGIAEEELV
jgi:hypothetical protein